jgi:hypothetical protein
MAQQHANMTLERQSRHSGHTGMAAAVQTFIRRVVRQERV